MRALAPHNETGDVHADLLLCSYKREVISDGSALAVASWWAGPHGYGQVLLRFAQFQEVDALELLEDVRGTMRYYKLGPASPSRDEVLSFIALNMLGEYVIAKGNLNTDVNPHRAYNPTD